MRLCHEPDGVREDSVTDAFAASGRGKQTASAVFSYVQNTVFDKLL